MTRFLFGAAFLVGAFAIVWIGQIFLGNDLLGLGVTILIGVVYAIGTWELWLFRRASNTLLMALNNISGSVDDLSGWLQGLHPSLRNAVRSRVSGERVGLPAPVLTPYLVGLLVMLGLLGTFVGMVDTLKGAVVALEGTSELEAIRAGLAAPIEGLGLAFGTSVAGVAASAMLGLLSTLSRRERLQASHELDSRLVDEFSQHSIGYQQKMAFNAIQSQAEALPEVAHKLTVLAENLEKMSDKVGEKLLTNQQQFQSDLVELHETLHEAMDRSLRASLMESGNLMVSTIQPIADQTMANVADSVDEIQQAVSKANQEHMAELSEVAKSMSSQVSESLKKSLSQQSSLTEGLVENITGSMSCVSDDLTKNSAALLEGFEDKGQQWLDQQQSQSEQMASNAVQQMSALEETVSQNLAELAQSLEAPMTRLMETASQTPKAAADVMEKLRAELSNNLARDNELLAQRTQLMEQLDALSATLEASSKGQRDAIDTLVERSTETLSKIGLQFGEQVGEESSKLIGVAERFASSSVEIASMSESFGAAVSVFRDSNAQLIENLARIETSLEQSNSRSDEQLAYYVAQAREIIDHNLLSHQQIIAALNSKKPEQLAVRETG